MNSENIDFVPVILAGGSGTRLWPLSRGDYPKQFLPLCGDLSLLQETVKRATQSTSRSPMLMCAEKHRFLTAEQLQSLGIDSADILLEPAARNTAPAIAAAAWHAWLQDQDAVLAVMPADHLIPDTDAFSQALRQAVEVAKANQLVTLGITPTHPETGYGYIEVSAEGAKLQDALPVKQFIEKPEAEAARQLIEKGSCYWNAGIFVFKASVFLDALAALKPEMHALTKKSVEKAKKDLDFVRLDTEPFEQCESISVDYAVMEHAEAVAMIPFPSTWSDIGSWDAVHQAAGTDEHGNASVGEVIHYDSEQTYAHATSRMVVTLGTKNISVIETSDVILVLNNDKAQSIKGVVELLKKDDRPELDTHTTVYRPWGHYQSLNLNPRFQVKRITVKPGAKLSLQKHFHRSEHWVVVSGTAIVTVGEKEIMLSENESTYIPLGEMHRLHNPGSIPLELIEVQSGSYLGEDDIVRVGDVYGRS